MVRKIVIRSADGRLPQKVEPESFLPANTHRHIYKEGEFSLVPMFTPALRDFATQFTFRGIPFERPEGCRSMLWIEGHRDYMLWPSRNTLENVYFGTYALKNRAMVDFAIHNLRYDIDHIVGTLPDFDRLISHAVRESRKCRFGSNARFTSAPNVVYLGYSYC